MLTPIQAQNVIFDGTLSGGTIDDLGIPSAFGQGNFAITAGATLEYTGSTDSTNRQVQLGSSGGIVSVTNSQTVLTTTGLVYNMGGLTKAGAGTLYLSGANTYSGGTVVANGTLVAFNESGSATGSGNIEVNNTGTLRISQSFNSPGSVAGNIHNDGIVEFAPTFSSSGQYSGQISGTGKVELNGVGTFTINGTHTYIGDTNIKRGTLKLGFHNRLPDNSALSITVSSPLPLFESVLDLNNFNETIGSLSGNGDIVLGSGNLTTGGNNNSTTFSGSIGGSGALIKVGSGNFYLDGPNTYAGSTVIADGTLIARNGSDSTTGFGVISVYSSAKLQIGDLFNPGSVSGHIVNDGLVTFENGYFAGTYSGNIVGTGSVKKTQFGTLTLTGNSNYTGGTTINGGTLLDAVTKLVCDS